MLLDIQIAAVESKRDTALVNGQISIKTENEHCVMNCISERTSTVSIINKNEHCFINSLFLKDWVPFVGTK